MKEDENGMELEGDAEGKQMDMFKIKGDGWRSQRRLAMKSLQDID